MRLIAIDLGDKRTGLAAGDTVTRLAGPVGVLEIPIAADNGGELLRALSRATSEQGAAAAVFGLPLNMDGTEGPRARIVRAFAARLAALCPALAIVFEDERLSTVRADWQMNQTGLTHGQKKQRRDALAAAAILQDHLLRLGQSPPSASGGPTP
ncbi:MAG: Holliday junction resolvase RuvX [Phycisphaerales bacterium]